MDIHLRHVVVCRHQQEGAYTVPCPTLSFIFSGLEFSQLPGFRIGPNATGLTLHPQGVPVHFGFNEQRENYAILFESKDIRLNTTSHGTEICTHDEWVPLPLFVPVESLRLEGWRLELERIRTAFLMPTAQNRLRAELGTLNLIKHMLDTGSSPSDSVSTAAKLKTLIDTDAGHSRSIDELSAECGYSADHLRLLFVSEFGTTPKQYRIRRRMAEAMDWISGSRLSAKEIAGRLGFAQLSHFSAAFKSIHGMQPREAIQRFRGSRLTPTPDRTEKKQAALAKGPASAEKARSASRVVL